MYIDQSEAGMMYCLLSQFAKLNDCPPNAWSDHEYFIHKLSLNAKELLTHIDNMKEHSDNSN